MKRILAILSIAILVLLLVPSAAVFAEAANPNIVYVDANAAPGGNGSSANPFKTIKEAKDYIRTIPAESKATEHPIVEIKDGTYFIDETLVFTEEDSGVTYKAANGASPIISGGEEITGTWTDEGNGIYSISYNRDKKLRALYVNGNRCYMTSKVITAVGSTGEWSCDKDSDSWAWEDVDAKAGVNLYTKELDPNTRNPDDIELMTQTTWNTTIVCVESLANNGGSVTATLQMPYAAIAQNLTSSNAYKFNGQNTVYNVFEWLDEEGEFYFDKTAKKLYYKPRAGEDLNSATVIAPKTETLIKIEGQDKDHKVKDLYFKGLKFAYTDWNLCEVDGSHGRASNQGAAAMVNLFEERNDGSKFHDSLYRAYDFGPAAIMVYSADNIIFLDNVICHTGNDAISLINDVSNSSIVGSIIYDIAGATIIVGHPQHMYIGDKGSTKGLFSEKELFDVNVEALCTKISIKNNYLIDMGLLFAGNPGVMIYAGKEITYEHNTLKNAPYSGISIGWGWWNLNGDDDSVVPDEPMDCLGKIIIKSNAFINCLTKLSDGGAIYTLGAMPESEISNNYIKDVAVGVAKTDPDKIRGIHLDEGSAYIYGEKNVIDIDPKFACVDCGLWGRQHDNDWDNNYSRTDRYSTWDWAPGSDVTNKHVDESGTWDAEATAIINAAGIEDAYKEAVEREFAHNYPKKNLTLIIALSVIGGVIVLGGIATVIILVSKKNKNKTKCEGKIA